MSFHISELRATQIVEKCQQMITLLTNVQIQNDYKKLTTVSKY